ncbi:hypothetical protein BG262_02880 [Floricoccus penangensis]|uniref:Uncharacterized protein n=1 Tax=Floricoccus penangensis TaxID=1859475 RepID=A0A9Q5JGN7_9LACT|nr:hypothetical protein [Floricoccus penangensis]OFI46759.1 hypothetical protein BG262_02880 [Floricoccus penangensis]
MKKLVQFNELVFNHTAFVAAYPDFKTEFRTTREQYSYRNGDYSPESCRARTVNSKTFDVEMTIDKSKFPCEDRNIIEQFVLDNLYKTGRLWAIQGDLLMWSLAKVDSISEKFNEKPNHITYVATFYLQEGIWHIAEPTATYFNDYHTCEVTDCYEALNRPLCDCSMCNIGLAPRKFCPPCRGQRLCDIPKDQLISIIGNCGDTKKISYSCHCQEPTAVAKSAYNDSTAVLSFNSGTMYPTDDVVIEINGEFTDLVIDFNGQKSKIEGNYKGKTFINSGVVENNCKAIDIDKFYSICSTDCSPVDSCDGNPLAINVKEKIHGMVKWSLPKGTSNILFYGFAEDDIQEVKIYVGGIAV